MTLALILIGILGPLLVLILSRRDPPDDDMSQNEPTEADNTVGCPHEVIVSDGTEEEIWAAMAECMGFPPGTKVESIGEPFTVGHIIRFKAAAVRFNSEESGRL